MPVAVFEDVLEPPPFSVDELAVSAWGAGVIDAEGCICCTWKKGKDRTAKKVHSQLAVRQGKRGVRLLRTLALLFGGRVIQNRPEYGRRTAQFSWSLFGKNMLAFLERIKPHLVLKEEQARLVMELEARRSKDGMLCKPRSPEFMAYAEIVVDRMHELNWTGRTPRNLSDSPSNPKHGGRPVGMKKGQGVASWLPRPELVS